MKAYTDSGRTWELKPLLQDSKGGKILHLYGPCSYYVADLLRPRDTPRTRIAIDVGGRNFGVSESVWVDWVEIEPWLAPSPAS